jgi:hypothetical protein
MMDSAPPPITLRSLGGAPAPPELAADMRLVGELPPAAFSTFWQVLGPSLADPLPKDAEVLLSTYCRTHGLDPDRLARALKSCRFLLREAARRDLSPEHFGADVAALHPPVPDAPAVQDLLLAGYAKARVALRTEILRGALMAHGNLLVGLDWRVDTVEHSDRGVNIRAPVAMLTLRFREGDETRRITLQVLPDLLAELEQACHRMQS